MRLLTEATLLEKKEEINELKKEINELTGQEKVFSKQLKEDWGCGTLEEAKKKLMRFETDLTQLDCTIKEKTEQLMETYFNED